MRYIRTFLVALLAFPLFGQLNVPLTIQETIYPGETGIDRVNDPVRFGIPIPDSANITSLSQVTLSGASVGQFKVMGRWQPSNNIKWLLVDTEASLNAGGTNTSYSLVQTTTGGNFGGANLATDNGLTITVDTGAAQFTIKKANFNGLDQVVVGGTTLVTTGSSKGLVLIGPVYPETLCDYTAPHCSTEYTSANDSTSTAIIEENGPVHTTIKATGYHRDASGNAYMRFTVRLHFYKGKTWVKATESLQNADYGKGNTFNTAYKGYEGYDWQITPNLPGATKSYSLGTHTSTPSTGTLGGSDNVYLYQAQSDKFKNNTWGSVYVIPYTDDTGYSIVKNGTTLSTGLTDRTNHQYPAGWASLTDELNNGIDFGLFYFSAYWPKSLEFNNGGSDIRVGIWAKENSIPYFAAWPQYQIHDVYMNFHTAANDPNADFRRFQFFLVGRASSRDYYNTTAALPHKLTDSTEEENYFKALGAAASPAISSYRWCCRPDMGIVDTVLFPVTIERWWGWQSAGSSQFSGEFDNKLAYLHQFLQRGFTGAYLSASLWFRYETESAFPRSDGFRWQDISVTGTDSADGTGYNLDGWGFPSHYRNWNSSYGVNVRPGANRNWIDTEHAAWYGLPYYYFLSGDLDAYDAMLDGPKDRFLRSDTSLNNGNQQAYINGRAVGHALMGFAHLGKFLQDIGDADYTTLRNTSAITWNAQAGSPLCVSGYPAGCSFGDPAAYYSWTSNGMSKERGLYFTGSNAFSNIGCEQKVGTGTVMKGLPNSPPSGLAYYYIAALDHNQFSQININVTSPQVGGTAAPIVEYIQVVNSSGGTWANLGATWSGGDLTTTGVKTITFTPPADWITSPQNGNAGSGSYADVYYWVRLHYTSTPAVYATANITVRSTSDSSTVFYIPNSIRGTSILFPTIFLQGVRDYRNMMGPSWANYDAALDVLDGVSTHALKELFYYTAGASYQQNHWRNGESLDYTNYCSLSVSPNTSNLHNQKLDYYDETNPFTGSVMYEAFYDQFAVNYDSTSWKPFFDAVIQRTQWLQSLPNQPEPGTYLTGELVDAILHPSSLSTQTITPTVVNNGGGSYTLSWTVPNNTQSYRGKWHTKTIVDWIGFDPTTNTWVGDPSTTMNFFGATTLANAPAPAAAGTTQTWTVTGLSTGLTANNFRIKATVNGAASQNPHWNSAFGGKATYSGGFVK